MFSPLISECFEILQNDFLPYERYTSGKRNADKKAHLAFPTATKHHPLNASTPPALPLPAHPFTLTMRPDIYWSSRCNLLHAVSLLQPYKVFLRVRITSRQIRWQVFYKWRSSNKYLYFLTVALFFEMNNRWLKLK